MVRRTARASNVVETTMLLTITSIVLSVIITVIITCIIGQGPDANGISIAIIVPAIVAPMLSYSKVHLMFQLAQAKEELRRLSITDELTQSFNRRHFIKVVEGEFTRAQRYQTPFSVIIFDIDDFKKINDGYGHMTGDMVLRSISTICKRHMRQQDTFARYGGEEFIVLLPETHAHDAWALAERIRCMIAASTIKHHTVSVQVTVSVGVATFDYHVRDFESLLIAADQALYGAKNSGKNCTIVAD